MARIPFRPGQTRFRWTATLALLATAALSMAAISSGLTESHAASGAQPAAATSPRYDLPQRATDLGLQPPALPERPDQVMPWLKAFRLSLLRGSRERLKAAPPNRDDALAELLAWAGDRRAATRYWRLVGIQGSLEGRLMALCLGRANGQTTGETLAGFGELPATVPPHLVVRRDALQAQLERANERARLLGKPAQGIATSHVLGAQSGLDFSLYSGRFLVLVIFRMDDPDAGRWLAFVEEQTERATKTLVGQPDKEMLAVTTCRSRVLAADGAALVTSPTAAEQQTALRRIRATHQLDSAVALVDTWLLDHRWFPPDRTCTWLIGPEGTVRDMVMGAGEDAARTVQGWLRRG